MRIGLFGGSFDPPHRGHLAVARAVRERFSLDRVLLAPAAIQPLKPDGAQATFADRLRMVELLCQNQNGIAASAIDAPRPDGAPNYTIDTIRRLRADLGSAANIPPHAKLPEHAAEPPKDPDIFVIVGADAFLHIRDWKDPAALLREARWIVVSRPGFDLHALDTLRLTPAERARVQTLPGFADPASATEVRNRLREIARATELRDPLRDADALWATAADLVPPAVLAYIRTHHLYGT